MKRVLVYGWLNHSNLGDDFFIEAYQHLFPNIRFIFSDHITMQALQEVDAVFFGGGSFLLGKPNIETTEALLCLHSKKIFYLGVGIETDIHPIHLQLMKSALLIATRSPDQVSRLQAINSNVRFIPDLAYSLQSKVKLSDKIDRSVLIMPNAVLVPQITDPHWKHAAWTYFKSEFVQFLDWLVNNNYSPHFFSMCHSNEADDDWAAAEIIGHMKLRKRSYLLCDRPLGVAQTTALVSQYQIIITQRFHGIVLSEMTRTPYVAIHHHDKLKLSHPGEGIFISYYGMSKHALIKAFNQANRMNYSSVLPIDQYLFNTLVEEVTNLL